MDHNESQSARKDRVTSLKNVSDKIEFIVDEMLKDIEALRRRILTDWLANNQTINDINTNLHSLINTRTVNNVNYTKLRDMMNNSLHVLNKELIRLISDYKLSAQSKASLLKEMKTAMSERASHLHNPLAAAMFEVDEVNKLLSKNEVDLNTRLDSIKTSDPFLNIQKAWNKKNTEIADTSSLGISMIKDIVNQFNTASIAYDEDLDKEIDSIQAHHLMQTDQFNLIIN